MKKVIVATMVLATTGMTQCPFSDIALGGAVEGILNLRHDKRIQALVVVSVTQAVRNLASGSRNILQCPVDKKVQSSALAAASGITAYEMFQSKNPFVKYGAVVPAALTVFAVLQPVRK